MIFHFDFYPPDVDKKLPQIDFSAFIIVVVGQPITEFVTNQMRKSASLVISMRKIPSND